MIKFDRYNDEPLWVNGCAIHDIDVVEVTPTSSFFSAANPAKKLLKVTLFSGKSFLVDGITPEEIHNLIRKEYR